MLYEFELLYTILECTPDDKRTWLFAATMSEEIHAITSRYLSNPYEVTIGIKNYAAENINHIYYVVHEKDRCKALKRIVDVLNSFENEIYKERKIRVDSSGGGKNPGGEIHLPEIKRNFSKSRQGKK